MLLTSHLPYRQISYILMHMNYCFLHHFYSLFPEESGLKYIAGNH